VIVKASDRPAGPERRQAPVRPRRPIVYSLLALLIVAGVVPLAVFGWRMTAFNMEKLKIKQDLYQLTLAESLAREVTAFVQAKQEQVGGVVQAVETSLRLAGRERLHQMLREGAILPEAVSRQESGLLKVVFMDESGEGWNAARVDYSDDPEADQVLVRQALYEALEGRSFVSGSLSLAGGAGRAVVIAQPVRAANRPVGVVSALVSLSPLEDTLAGLSEKLYNVFVVDGEGALVAHSAVTPVPERVAASPLVHVFLRSRGNRNMPYVVTTDGEQQRMLGAYATAEAVDWGAFVEMNEDEAYFTVQQMRRSTFKWSAGAVLLAAVLAVLFASRLANPLRDLADGALRIARGHYDERLDIRSGNEVGQVAESFNIMAFAVQEHVVKLQDALAENKELFLSTVKMLARAIDEKDPYTRGHSERVTRYSVAIARALDLGEQEVEAVEIAGLLHDVGKIGVDDRIIRKPSILTDEEFALMKEHPEKGARILSPVKQLAEMIPGMRYHHEKVDGSGYPEGLAGEQIPLMAQIISVADTFDAMTMDRPYQRGMDPDFVLSKLKGWIGERFRQDVVEAFERAYRSGEISLRKPTEDSRPAVS
jgi:putative nucleotidyltransferase with HDIG domain